MLCGDFRRMVLETSAEDKKGPLELTRGERSACYRHMRDCQPCIDWLEAVGDEFEKEHPMTPQEQAEIDSELEQMRELDAQDPEADV